jgi:hypothetical protein
LVDDIRRDLQENTNHFNTGGIITMGVKRIGIKKCCHCGYKTTEPMAWYIYGGKGEHPIGDLYSCINVPECIDRTRKNFEMDSIIGNIKKGLGTY